MKYTVLPEEREFLETVLAEPDDVSARLVYADWLESAGDLRAEWLRLELEFHGLTSLSHRYRPLRKRLRALFPKMDADWALAVTREPLNIADRHVWNRPEEPKLQPRHPPVVFGMRTRSSRSSERVEEATGPIERLFGAVGRIVRGR